MTGVATHTVAPQQDEGSITPEQLQTIAHARHRGRKIRRAATIAAISGWTMAFFAAMSLLSGLFSVRALFLGLGLSAVAYVEIRGARGVRTLDLSAPRLLGLNQVGLFVIVTIYAAWGIIDALVGPGPYDEYLAAGGQMAETLAPIDRLTKVLTVVFYAALIVSSLITQAGVSVYYFTRRGWMVAYLKDTPKWVVDMLRVVA